MQAQQYRSRHPQNPLTALVVVVGGLMGLGGLAMVAFGVLLPSVFLPLALLALAGAVLLGRGYGYLAAYSFRFAALGSLVLVLWQMVRVLEHGVGHNGRSPWDIQLHLTYAPLFFLPITFAFLAHFTPYDRDSESPF